MKTSNHPINILGGGRSKVDYVSETINYELNNYFTNVVINKKIINGKYAQISTVPVIALFTNEKYRNLYIDYTKNSTDKYTIRLRRILSDETQRRNHYALMIEKIGDTITKYGVETFQITTLEYTKESFATDGKRKKYYLNVKGIKSNEKDVKDLSDLYIQIKEIRNKVKKDENQKTLSQNA